MKRYKLRLSKLAIEDIEQVLLYTYRRLGERQFLVYKELIRRALADISNNPTGWPARERPEIHRDARTFHIARRGHPARHFFLYRVVGDEFIDVARLLHDSMDIRRHLREEFE